MDRRTLHFLLAIHLKHIYIYTGIRIMKTAAYQRGMAIFLVLVIAVIVFMLGVSIAGLTTQEGRSSLRRSHEIITRQTALAGIKYAQNLLLEDWDNEKLAKVDLFKDAYYPENGCYYSVSVKLHTPDQCIFTSEAYFKETLSGGRKLWARGVEATFARSSYNFALQGIGSPMWIPHTTNGYTYYTQETPESLCVVDAEIDGKIATKQRTGQLTMKPRPHIEGSGDDAHVVPVQFSTERDAVLIMPELPEYVTVKKEPNSIDEPVQFPEPGFPLNLSKTDYDTRQSTENHPGSYASLSTSASSSSVTVGGGGCYSIRDCSITTGSSGNVRFEPGTYYIENLTVKGGGALTLSSGNYFVKHLLLSGGEGLMSGGQLDLKVSVVNKRPVNIIVTESAELSGVRLNPSSVNQFADPSNLIINGTEGCRQNKLTNCSGAFIYQNKGNVVDVSSTGSGQLSIDGSIVGNGLNVTGNTLFSCHKERIQTNQITLTKWEEI